jgi:Protein of unknown function (DUF3106)
VLFSQPLKISFKSILCRGVLMLLAAVYAVSAVAEQPPAAGMSRNTEAGGVTWASLTPAQQLALKPLEPRWASLPLDRQQKWMDVAARFPRLSSGEQARVHGRMAAWSNLSPEEHGQARLNFQEAKQMPSEDRQAKWQAYQTLSVDQKRLLATRHREQSQGLSAAGILARREELNDPARATHKSNVTPNPGYAPAPRPMGGGALLRAAPGATTSLMSRRPKPPEHQQTGLPKIQSTAEFVDPLTLLPQRGPQGAAVVRATAPRPSKEAQR